MLFKGFFIFYWFAYFSFNFINFFLIKILFYIILIYFLNILIIFFSFWVCLYLILYKCIVYTFLNYNNSPVFFTSSYHNNIESTHFFWKIISKFFNSDEQKVTILNEFFKSSQYLPVSSDTFYTFTTWFSFKTKIGSAYLKKSEKLELESFLFFRYKQERFDYIRTQDELIWEFRERRINKFLPPYTEVEYKRVFRDSYREYSQRFGLNKFNPLHYDYIGNLKNFNFINKTEKLLEISETAIFSTPIFISNFCKFLLYQFQKYFVSEIFFFKTTFLSKNWIGDIIFALNNKILFFYLNIFCLSTFIALVVFFWLTPRNFSNKILYFTNVKHFTKILKSQFKVLYVLSICYICKSQKNFINNILNKFEFIRFKKFISIFPDFFNFKTSEVLKSQPYDNSTSYFQKSMFSLKIHNNSISAYTGPELWDSLDYMLSPYEFNLFYANYPFDFTPTPLISLYRPRLIFYKSTRLINQFFTNQFSFPFTYFEENFTKFSSYVNKYVYLTVFITITVPVFFIEVFRFCFIQILFVSIPKIFVIKRFANDFYAVFINLVRFFGSYFFYFVFRFSFFYYFIFYFIFKTKIFNILNSLAIQLCLKMYNVIKLVFFWTYNYMRKLFKKIQIILVICYNIFKFFTFSYIIKRSFILIFVFICLYIFIDFIYVFIKFYVNLYFWINSFSNFFFTEIFIPFLHTGRLIKFFGINYNPSFVINFILFLFIIFYFFFTFFPFFNFWFDVSRDDLEIELIYLYFPVKLNKFLFGQVHYLKKEFMEAYKFWHIVPDYFYGEVNLIDEDDEEWDWGYDTEEPFFLYDELEEDDEEEDIEDGGIPDPENLLWFDEMQFYLSATIDESTDFEFWFILFGPGKWFNRYRFPNFNFFPFKQLNYYFPYQYDFYEIEMWQMDDLSVRHEDLYESFRDEDEFISDEENNSFQLYPIYNDIYNTFIRFEKFNHSIFRFQNSKFLYQNIQIYSNFFRFIDMFYKIFEIKDFFNNQTLFNLPFFKNQIYEIWLVIYEYYFTNLLGYDDLVSFCSKSNFVFEFNYNYNIKNEFSTSHYENFWPYFFELNFFYSSTKKF